MFHKGIILISHWILLASCLLSLAVQPHAGLAPQCSNTLLLLELDTIRVTLDKKILHNYGYVFAPKK